MKSKNPSTKTVEGWTSIFQEFWIYFNEVSDDQALVGGLATVVESRLNSQTVGLCWKKKLYVQKLNFNYFESFMSIYEMFIRQSGCAGMKMACVYKNLIWIILEILWAWNVYQTVGLCWNENGIKSKFKLFWILYEHEVFQGRLKQPGCAGMKMACNLNLT